MIVDKIEKLKELKVYSGLLKDGIIPVKVNTHYEMNKLYQTRLTVNQQFKDSVTRSKTEASEAFECCELTITRAVNYMNSPTAEELEKEKEEKESKS